MIEHALLTAIRAHRGQKYGAHRPYILHIVDVVSRVLHQPKDVIVAAILHDAVEDADVTIDEVRAMFGERVAGTVTALTHDKYPPTAETYAEYIDRLSKNPDAVTVKFADLEANLEADPPESLRERYEAAWNTLSDVAFPDDFDHEGTP